MTHVMAVNIQPNCGQLLYVPVMFLFVNQSIVPLHAGLHQGPPFPLPGKKACSKVRWERGTRRACGGTSSRRWFRRSPPRA